MRLIKFTIICLSLLAGVGCQSIIKIAGTEDHKTVYEKWRELVSYAESDLADYGIKIIAQLKVKTLNSKEEFYLSNIKLSSSSNALNIDLLSPQFETKLVCDPVCYQLTEYVRTRDEDKDGYTLLTAFFDKHEYELFDFYAKTMVLNKKIATLEAMNSVLLSSYFLFLLEEEKIFESLDEFSPYLENSLSELAYQDYIAHQYASSEDSNNSMISKVRSRANSSGAIIPISPGDFNKFSHGRSWFGKTVCSYDENIFGVVAAETNHIVHVSMQGRAKNLLDGVEVGAVKGRLFSRNQAIDFETLTGVRMLSKDDVYLCEIE